MRRVLPRVFVAVSRVLALVGVAKAALAVMMVPRLEIVAVKKLAALNRVQLVLIVEVNSEKME